MLSCLQPVRLAVVLLVDGLTYQACWYTFPRSAVPTFDGIDLNTCLRSPNATFQYRSGLPTAHL